MPILLIYWYSSTPTPSTVILLDSTVVMPEDDPDKSKWNCYRFKISHAKTTKDDLAVHVTRVFSCPKEGRDRWVYAINKALLIFEKQKAKARKVSTLSPSPPRNSFQMTWATDPFPTAMSPRKSGVAPTPPTSPRSQSPTSPRSQFKLPLPRTEPPLIGEAFLDSDYQ